jgi:hypothetical protein
MERGYTERRSTGYHSCFVRKDGTIVWTLKKVVL